MGKMFYEVHPQLWGQGIMSEAFVEVLRFAMEEIGCTAVQVSNRLVFATAIRWRKLNTLSLIQLSTTTRLSVYVPKTACALSKSGTMIGRNLS